MICGVVTGDGIEFRYFEGRFGERARKGADFCLIAFESGEK